MAWTISEASDVLSAAFPWGAHVTVPSGGEFVAIRYEVVEVDDATGEANIRFERDPGDTQQRASRAQLKQASATGRVELNGAVIRQPEPRDLHLLADPLRDLVGPQAGSNASWVRRMRIHQSWWRTFRLRAPFGTGPSPSSTAPRGNMLTAAGAEAGLNFLTPEARTAFEDRLALTNQGVDPWRTSRNLLASQPMAFNIFGHLRHHLDIATKLFRSLLGDALAEVTSIEIERLSDALGDRTAFDAFATYRSVDGSPGCVAIETKLSEPFSQQAYDWTKYVGHTAFDPAAWSTDDPAILGDPVWSQLWRNHLLARAEAARLPELGQPTVLVVHHPLDPHCASSVDGYRGLLALADDVQRVAVDVIVDALRPIVAGRTDHERWVEDLHDRYIDLRLSEPLVELLRRT